MSVYHPHVVSTTESWINDLAEVDYYAFNTYIPLADYRCDRKGGGALVLVDACLQPALAYTGSELDLECNVISVCIGSNNSRSLISTIYCPPNTSISENRKLINYLQNLSRKADSFIVVGYFNLLN